MGTPNQDGRSPVGRPAPRVVALAGPAAGRLVRDLESAHGMDIQLAETPDEMVAVVDASGADIAILFTAGLTGWPITEAEGLATRLGGRIPLVVMAEVMDDAEVLEQRIAGPMVHVMTRASLTGDVLASLVTTSLARAVGRA